MSSHDNLKNREKNCCDKKMSPRDDDDPCQSYKQEAFRIMRKQ